MCVFFLPKDSVFLRKKKKMKQARDYEIPSNHMNSVYLSHVQIAKCLFVDHDSMLLFARLLVLSSLLLFSIYLQCVSMLDFYHQFSLRVFFSHFFC